MRRINLVPRNERVRTSTDIGMLALIGLAVVVIFGLGMGYYMLSGQLDQKKADLAAAQAQVTQLKSQVAALDSYQALAKQREDREEIVQGIYARRTLVADVLDDLSQAIPDTAWFQSLTIKTDDPVIVSGIESSSSSDKAGSSVEIEGDTYSFEQVAQVLVRLKLIPSLEGVTLSSAGEPKGSVDSTKQVKGFSVKATLKQTQAADVPLPLSQGEVAGQ